jgi:hypothetical protein
MREAAATRPITNSRDANGKETEGYPFHHYAFFGRARCEILRARGSARAALRNKKYFKTNPSSRPGSGAPQARQAICVSTVSGPAST